MVASRIFNNITLDEKNSIITKSSDKNELKIIDEINWYIMLHNDLKSYIPEIIEYNTEHNDTYIKMEYIKYPTLHDGFINATVNNIFDIEYWENVFININQMLQKFSKHTFSFTLNNNNEYIMANYHNDLMLNTKTIHRLNSLFINSKKLQIDKNLPIIINGKTYPSLQEIINKIPQLCKDIIDANFNGKFQVIHGDLCFPNILYNDNDIKLVDPRGRYGNIGGKVPMYGDVRYELAKLLHSFHGQYDYIIEDMFDVDILSINNINYNLKYDNIVSNNLYNTFKEIILYNDNELLKQVLFIEGLLFLSMVDLHTEDINRQYVMLAKGIEILSDLSIF